MANSIRELVIQSLATQMATITTANGYDVNVGLVERARREFTQDLLPAIGIFDAEEETTSKYDFDKNIMQVSVELHSDAKTENRSVHANKLMASIKKAALSGDTTHAGNAQRTGVATTTINIPQDDDETVVSVLVIFAITYEEITGDPYTTP
jgi:hypothetical protein